MRDRITHADSADGTPPIDQSDLRWTPRGRARESRASSATGRVDAHGQAPTAPHKGPPFWILLAKGWREWRTALIVVQPDTVVRWHRQWLRRQWTRRSTRTRPGRPNTDAAVRTLIGKMAAANPLWGAPRIHGELCKLGIAVSERTVSRLLRRPRRRSSQTWRTFLTNHVTTLVSMDFFAVPILTG